MAVLFYLERTAFVDISFHIFYILKDGYFAIQNFRFGSFVTQAFPLVTSYLSLPLNYIMLSYSLGFALVYWVHFNLQFRIDYKYGLVMLMLSTLMVNDTFYWIQSELPQGLAFLCLLLAFLSYYSKKKKAFFFYPSFIFLIFITSFIHPLVLFPFLFGVTFLYIKREIDADMFLGATLSYLVFFGIKTLFFATSYDSQSMEGINNIFILFPSYFTLDSNIQFLSDLITDYYLVLIGLILVLVYYLFKERFFLFFLVFLFFVGYAFLVNISYPQGAAKFYMENLYLPLSIFVAFPLAFDLFPSIGFKYFGFILLLGCLLRCTHIYCQNTPYSERVDYLLEMIDSCSEDKVIRAPSEEEEKILQMVWATPYEIWLLSTIKTGETKSMVLIDNPEELNWARDRNKSFITKWGVFDYENLPERYFNFQDTSPYRYK